MISAGSCFCYLALILAVTGCTPSANEDQPGTAAATSNPFKPPLTGDATLTSIGELQIEDTLKQAKVLFPAPPGADIVAQPELTLEGETHYGWSTQGKVFDAFAAGDRLTTISLLRTEMTDAERHTQIDRELERYDEPNENAEGETAAAYLWRDGDFVRIVVDFFAG